MQDYNEFDDNTEKKKEKKHLLYRLFNPERKEDAKPDPTLEGPDNIKKCFKLYKKNITTLLYLNLIYIFGNFPLLFGIYALTGSLNTHTTAASSDMFSVLHGVMLTKNSPVSLALFGVHGYQTTTQVITKTTFVFILLSLLCVFTFGIINTGCAYILRGIVRRDHVFFWNDFKGAIKKNFRQAMFVGLIDFAISLLLIYDFYFFYINRSAMFYVMIMVFAIYNMMRFYIYPLLITFELSTWKLLKNSVILAILGFKRNILAFLGACILVLIEYFLLGIFYPFGIVLALSLLISTCAFFGMFAAWAQIKKVMIDPYEEKKRAK